MKTEEAVSKIAEILNVLVGNFMTDCGGDFVDGSYCKTCKYYHQCKKMTKAQDLNSELQSMLVNKSHEMLKVKPVHIWVDGWCKNNGKINAQAGWTVVALIDGKQDSLNRGHVRGPQTNNVAEYHAFINGLHWGRQYKCPIVIHTDSALVIGQVTKGWKVKAEHLEHLVAEAKALVVITDVTIIKEPRERLVEILGH